MSMVDEREAAEVGSSARASAGEKVGSLAEKPLMDLRSRQSEVGEVGKKKDRSVTRVAG